MENKICSNKNCSLSGQFQPLDNFWKRISNKKDGHHNKCKSCSHYVAGLLGTKNKIKNQNKPVEEIYNQNETKFCLSCNTKKPKTKNNWYINSRRKDGLSFHCKQCRSVLASNSVAIRVCSYRSGAKSRNFLFPESDEVYTKIMLNPCYYCFENGKIKFDREDPELGKFNGINRIDTTKDYVEENCIACCWDCNDHLGKCTLQLMKANVELAQQRKIFPAAIK